MAFVKHTYARTHTHALPRTSKVTVIDTHEEGVQGKGNIP